VWRFRYHLRQLVCRFPDIVSRAGLRYEAIANEKSISYFTSTIGLGCRAGSYMIFGILTMAAALGEISLEVAGSRIPALRRTGDFVLTFLELANVCWLVWMTIAQTF
jgi:hypothetical protein